MVDVNKEENYKFAIEKDVILSQDCLFNNYKYFLVSDIKEKYLKLNKEQYICLKKLLPYLNGKMNLSQIEEKVKDDNVYNIDNPIILNSIIEKSIMFLKKNKLFAYQKKDQLKKVEYDLSGKKVKEIQLADFQRKHQKLLNIIFKMLMFLSVVFIAYSIYLLYLKKGLAYENYIKIKCFNWKNVYLWEYIFVVAFVGISIFFHELGHILMANYCNVKVKSLNILLRMGISPVFYVRYKNLYAIKSKKKIRIMLAGVYFNLFLSSVFWVILNFYPDWKFSLIMVVNFLCILNNLAPTGANDGYNIISTLLGIEGLRWKMLKDVGNIINYGMRVLNIKMLFYLLYFIASYGITFWGLCKLIYTTADFMNITIIRSKFIIILVVVLMVAITIKYVIDLFEEIKKIGS